MLRKVPLIHLLSCSQLCYVLRTQHNSFSRKGERMEKELVVILNSIDCKKELISKEFASLQIYEFDDLEELIFTIKDMKQQNYNIVAFI